MPPPLTLQHTHTHTSCETEASDDWNAVARPGKQPGMQTSHAEPHAWRLEARARVALRAAASARAGAGAALCEHCGPRPALHVYVCVCVCSRPGNPTGVAAASLPLFFGTSSSDTGGDTPRMLGISPPGGNSVNARSAPHNEPTLLHPALQNTQHGGPDLTWSLRVLATRSCRGRAQTRLDICMPRSNREDPSKT